jgi:7-cyano-7-deazaguanine reductase
VSNTPTRKLDIVTWPSQDAIVVKLDCSEFTSLCPVTGQPDFARLRLSYRPRNGIVETKSFKLYLWSFRTVPAFNEKIAHAIAADFFAQVQPEWVAVEMTFNARGGISVVAEARKER